MYINHICIQTNHYDESLKFYMDIFGFKLLNETPNFHNRAFNTWIELNGFMIELQTSKHNVPLSRCDDESEGIVHFCLYSKEFDADFDRINNHKLATFKEKNGSKIYTVENGRLFKLIAPEGTIIEVRDNEFI